MILKIEKQTRKPLVEREEIIAKAEANVTPKKADVQEQIATMLNKPKELVIVKHVYPQFGKKEAKIIVYVYDTLEAVKKFEKQKEKKEKAEAKEEVTKEKG